VTGYRKANEKLGHPGSAKPDWPRLPIPGWALLAGLVAWPPAAHAQGTAPVSVSVDATAPGTPLERVWPFFGYDEINYTTTPEGKALLGALANANSAPVHVRSHFLFNTGDGTPGLKWGSTNVYTEDAAGNPVYDWLLTDGIMDTITAAGAYPFVELGLMPQALSTHPVPYRNSSSMLLDGGSVYPPTDYTKWASLIQTWATHAANRYPDVETRWLWELWNEPDISYWQGTFEEYAKLYDYTESALHGVIPGAALGGPAVAGPANGFLRQFLEHCATGTNAVTGTVGTRLDLVSFHAKGGAIVSGDHVEMNLGSQLRLHRVGFKAVAAVPSFATTPIYITEADPDGCAACPVSSTPANAYRTSPAYGAYELAMMKHSLELEAKLGVKLGGVLTWAFTFPGMPYFAGYRELATNGISLPVLGAFKLLGALSGSRIPLASSGAHELDDLLTNSVRAEPEIDGMAALAGSSVQVLLWNYHDDLVAAPAAPVQLAVKLPASFGQRVRISHLRVDQSHGDAHTVWVSQGMPASPSSAQIAALQQAMAPSLLVPDKTIPVAADGSVMLDFDLPRFGVSLLTLVPGGEGELAGGPGNDAPAASGCACRAGRVDPTLPLAPFGIAVVLLASRARRKRSPMRSRNCRKP
jgi:xylan 1,4-beta-xylosidase